MKKVKAVDNNRAQVLIVGVPGRMQESLRTLLNANPLFEVVDAGENCWPPAEGEVRAVPDLVLLDFGLPALDAIQSLEWIKTHWTSTRCLVLATTVRQQTAAKAAGADEVLLKGFLAAEFFSTLKGLLKGKALHWEFCGPKAPDAEGQANSPERAFSLPGEPLIKAHSFLR